MVLAGEMIFANLLEVGESSHGFRCLAGYVESQFPGFGLGLCRSFPGFGFSFHLSMPLPGDLVWALARFCGVRKCRSREYGWSRVRAFSPVARVFNELPTLIGASWI